MKLFKFFIISIITLLFLSSCYVNSNYNKNDNIPHSTLQTEIETKSDITVNLKENEVCSKDIDKNENTISYNNEQSYTVYELRNNFSEAELLNIESLTLIIDLYNVSESEMTEVISEDFWELLKNLRVLNLIVYEPYNGDCIVNYNFLSLLTNLEALTVSGGNDFIREFDAKCISMCTNLEELKLFGIINICNADSLSLLHSLYSIEIGYTTTRNVKIDSMDWLVSLKSLKKIYLGGLSLDGETYEGTWISEMTNLEDLCLDSTRITNITDLSKLKKLQNLELYRCDDIDSYDFILNLSGIKNFTYTEYCISDELIEEFKLFNPNCNIICAKT